MQVGSKNAAFFMGSSIKVVTKRAEEAYVHELGLAADVLEQRYRNQEVGGKGEGHSLAPLTVGWGCGGCSLQGWLAGPLKTEVLRTSPVFAFFKYCHCGG